MNSLRLEADESAAKVEELLAKVKVLEQENLSKEQEITSLQHKNGLLEAEVEKLEGNVKKHKDDAEAGTSATNQNESLNRRLALLEEEAEQADKTLRETNEKYVAAPAAARPQPRVPSAFFQHAHKFPLSTKGDSFPLLTWLPSTGSDRLTSRLVTSNEKSRPSSPSAISGRQSTRRWPRSTRPSRRSWKHSRPRLATFERGSRVWLRSMEELVQSGYTNASCARDKEETTTQLEISARVRSYHEDASRFRGD